MLRAKDRTRGALWLVAATAIAPGCARHKASGLSEPLRVAAASDLSQAFRQLGAAYEKETGQKIVFSFGATGLLERQIAEGAPFDVFAAADVSFVDDAVRAGACSAASKRLYAVGRIAIVPAPGVDFVHSLADFTDPRVRKIAIANPEHAPYGRAAREAMRRAGVWNAVEPKVVYGENVHQALEFADSGNADVAVVALALVVDRSRPPELVPAELHDPIEQALAVCARSPDRAGAAERFCKYLSSPEGSGVMRKFGFAAPSAHGGASP